MSGHYIPSEKLTADDTDDTDFHWRSYCDERERRGNFTRTKGKSRV
jgi:hypothetical protein